jgi:hypothetical protein
LATGKPFIHNFLPNGGDMLRLNMAVPVTDRSDPAFSPLGIVAAAVSGLTDPMYNATASLEFIPNMDGFPNGRRLEDDVTRIELQAVGGVALAAIGLWYDDYTAGGANPVTQDLLDVLTYTTGVDANDMAFQSSFPYVAAPHSGTGDCSGLEIAYTTNRTSCPKRGERGYPRSAEYHASTDRLPQPDDHHHRFRVRPEDSGPCAHRVVLHHRQAHQCSVQWEHQER